MSLALVTHRLVVDPSFARQFEQDPLSALASAGLELNEDEVAAVQSLLGRSTWRNLSSPTQVGIEQYPWLAEQTTPQQKCLPI